MLLKTQEVNCTEASFLHVWECGDLVNGYAWSLWTMILEFVAFFLEFVPKPF